MSKVQEQSLSEFKKALITLALNQHPTFAIIYPKLYKELELACHDLSHQDPQTILNSIRAIE